MKNLFFLFVTVILWSNFALAADLRGLKDLFKQSFSTKMYQENFCGPNIQRFAQAAAKEGIDLKNSFVIQIENDGPGDYGLVSAVSVRGKGKMMWSHHVIFLADGEVFDFDFLNQPTVYELSKYLDLQFIPKESRFDSKFKKNKVGPYRLSIYPTYEYLEYLERKISTKDIRVEIYLSDYLPTYFK